MQITAKDILNSVNAVRANPQIVMVPIKEQLNRFQSNTVYRNSQGIKIRTMSGKQAWQDALLSLQRQKAKNNLNWNQKLSVAAQQYKVELVKNKNVNPFDIIKEYCSYQGSITVITNESDLENNMNELMANIVVGDSDDKKSGRTALFHPAYKQFACSVQIQPNKIIIFMIFAEKVDQIQQNSKKAKGTNQENNANTHEKNNYKNDYKNDYKNENNSQSNPGKTYLKKGRQFIDELNKIRKDPKSLIIPLKNEMSKFKDDHKTLVTEYGLIATKEGEIPYEDLISQIQSQYALPSIKEVQGLSIAALQQLLQMEAQLDKQTQADIMIERYCSSSEGIRSIKLKQVEGMPINAMVLRLILGDGDKKRTARRKLLSPICKAIGCSISNDMLVVNVGESAKDNKEATQQFMSALQKVKIKKVEEKLKTYKEVQEYKPKKQVKQKIVVKKTSKSHTQERDGRLYKITSIYLKYKDQTEQEIIEEELIE